MAYRQKEYNYNDKLTKDQNLLMDKLYKMRMSGIAEAFENQLMNPNSGLESFETRFSEIINHEWSGRENKKFNRLLKQATLKYCIWRIPMAGFAEQNGRNAKLNGRITFDY